MQSYEAKYLPSLSNPRERQANDALMLSDRGQCATAVILLRFVVMSLNNNSR
jgi:hypothetical protein